jgi:hypothetical protein
VVTLHNTTKAVWRMDQMSLSDAELANKKKRTRRELILAEMERMVPWTALVKQLEPFYRARRGHASFDGARTANDL